MKRFLIIALTICMLLQFWVPAAMADQTTEADTESTALTQDWDLRQKIAYFYRASLEYAEKSSFNGYCAFYVNTQLYLMKINRKYVAGNGNDEFDNYRYLSQSNGGYNIKAYPASSYSLRSALNAISNNGTQNAYNILVGFQQGRSTLGRKYGHTCFIHAIIDGTVYFSDSQKVTIGGVDYPEGTPVTASIDAFAEFYRPWTLDGLIHFTYDVAGHVCDKGKVLFQENVHPHRFFYQCAACGQAWKDVNTPQYNGDCQACNVPHATELHFKDKVYLQGEDQLFSWNATEFTTKYQLILETADGSGNYIPYATYETTATDLTLRLPAGEYRAKVRSINENGRVPGGTEPAYADSAWVHCFVVAEWDCTLYGHNRTVWDRREASCTTEGYVIYDCSYCEYRLRDRIHPLGHRYDSGTFAVEPTQEAAGEIVYRCRACCDEKRMPIPALSANPFTDLTLRDYYYPGAVWAYGSGITLGTGEGKFAPRDTATRAQVVTFLWRAAGSPEPKTVPQELPFVDVNWDSYYGEALLWAVESGITYGVSENQFGPEQPVTRGQFVTFLYRAAGQPQTQCGTVFADIGLGQYYDEAVLWATRSSITSGMSETKFCPHEPCTRAQIVTFLYRFYNWL